MAAGFGMFMIQHYLWPPTLIQLDMSRRFLPFVVAIACLFVIIACGSNSNDPFADCAQGRPVAIFSDSLEAVARHQFEIKDKIGMEQVAFKNGVALEVYQSGCDLVRQEFRFQLP